MKGQETSVHSTPHRHDDTIMSTYGEEVLESDGNPALSLVIYHLGLRELLVFQCVCKSFRDTIVENLLLWRDIKVDAPLSYRITNDVLWDITSRATGKLQSLALLNCWNITDVGLFRVIHANPCITKLHIPGCHQVTGDGVVSMMRHLNSAGYNKLNQLRIHGVRDVRKEHLEILNHLFEQQNQSTLLEKTQMSQGKQPMVFRQWRSSSSFVELNADESIECYGIDIDMCPKCNDATLVFDCTRDKCRSINDKIRECRGCNHCIPRCIECSGCLGDGEVGEENECSDVVCLSCWLRLPKCGSCNRAHCSRHWTMSQPYICESCVHHQGELPKLPTWFHI